MERILIFYQHLILQEEKRVWVHKDQLVKEFKNEMVQKETKTTYEHFFYHLESKCRLNENQTWMENCVVNADHIIYV